MPTVDTFAVAVPSADESLDRSDLQLSLRFKLSATPLTSTAGSLAGAIVQSLHGVRIGVVPLDAGGAPHKFIPSDDTSVTALPAMGKTPASWEYRGTLDVGRLLPLRNHYAVGVEASGSTDRGAFGPVVFRGTMTKAGSDLGYHSSPWLRGTTTQWVNGLEPGYAMSVTIDKAASRGGTPVARMDRVVAGVVPIDRYGVAQGMFVPGLPNGVPTDFVAGTEGKVPVLIRPRDLGYTMNAEFWVPAIVAEVTPKSADGGVKPAYGVFFDPQAPRPIAVAEPGWGVPYGRLRYGFYLGAIISQRSDDTDGDGGSGFDFTKVTPHLRFVADTSLESDPTSTTRNIDFDDIHTVFDLAFTSTSVFEKSADNSTSLESVFSGTAKTLSAGFGVDWRLFQSEPLDALVLSFGPSVRSGVHTVVDETNTVFDDSAAQYWGLGARFVGFGVRSTGEFSNPLPRHYLGFYWGENDLLEAEISDGRKRSTHRLFVDSLLIVEPNSGFYVGLEANLGQGPDDLRVNFGFAGTAGGLLRNLQGLIQPQLTQ